MKTLYLSSPYVLQEEQAVKVNITNMEDLDYILRKVTKPARYTGHEWNSVVKDWDQVEVKMALAYPDVYEVGMSNLGLMILYDILNREESILA